MLPLNSARDIYLYCYHYCHYKIVDITGIMVPDHFNDFGCHWWIPKTGLLFHSNISELEQVTQYEKWNDGNMNGKRC